MIGILRSSRVFLPSVYLVPRLLVAAMACGFGRFESDMPPGDEIRGDFGMKKQKVRRKKPKRSLVF